MTIDPREKDLNIPISLKVTIFTDDKDYPYTQCAHVDFMGHYLGIINGWTNTGELIGKAWEMADRSIQPWEGK